MQASNVCFVEQRIDDDIQIMNKVQWLIKTKQYGKKKTRGNLSENIQRGRLRGQMAFLSC